MNDRNVGIALDRFTVSALDGAVQITTQRGQIFIIDDDVETLEVRTLNSSNPPETFTYADLAALAPPAILGTDGTDTLSGTDAGDDIRGLAGDDWILPGGGRDTVDGGAGRDMVSFAGTGQGITVLDTADGFAVLQAGARSALTDVERITGTSLSDTFNAGAGSFRGLGGRDAFFAAGSGTGHYDGGAGRDIVSYIETAGQGVAASLFRGTGWEGDAAGDSYTDIEELTGSNFDDRLWGDNRANVLNGARGDDIIVGGAGQDTAVFAKNIGNYAIIRDTSGITVDNGTGVDGADTLFDIEVLRFADVVITYGSDGADIRTAPEGFAYLGAGDDLLLASGPGLGVYAGGGGKGILSYEGSTEGIHASLLRGRGWEGDAAGDRFDNFEWLRGTDHNDTLDGSRGRDTLEGGAGDDTLTGGFGDDYILAGFGTDTIVFSGARSEYRVETQGIRTEVEHLGGGVDGFDIIGHAEVLRFADGDVVL